MKRALEDREGEIESLNQIGLVFSVLGLGQSQKTLDNGTEALRLSQELGYRAGEAQALTAWASRICFPAIYLGLLSYSRKHFLSPRE